MNDIDSVLKAKESGKIDISVEKVVLMGHSLGALTAILASGVKLDDQLEYRCQKVLDNLSLTNLSSRLQCQLVDITLPDRKNMENLSSIIGMNSFGSFLWQKDLANQINIPIFLTGGTFDLVTD